MRAFLFRVRSGSWYGPVAHSEGSRFAVAVGPLAAIGKRMENLDPILFLSGLAVLSAGLVVLRTARVPKEHKAPTMAPAAIPLKRYTAEEALVERASRAGDREVLLEALAGAATTFYSIAGHLPGEASEQAVRKADDLRELVWLNRG